MPRREKNTGAAVIVIPGGGFTILAMDLEGTEACDWPPQASGVTCVAREVSRAERPLRLAMQVPPAQSGPVDAVAAAGRAAHAAAACAPTPRSQGMWTRTRSACSGFSAGGFLVAEVEHALRRSRCTRRWTPADQLKARVRTSPSPIYPGHLAMADNERRAEPGHRRFTSRQADAADLPAARTGDDDGGPGRGRAELLRGAEEGRRSPPPSCTSTRRAATRSACHAKTDASGVRLARAGGDGGWRTIGMVAGPPRSGSGERARARGGGRPQARREACRRRL